MKRSRGRGRKPSNPANRSYESNGPDVKIRGNASQIYDKYLQYARDAQTSGDRVNAEAYLQHAEHYYRVIAANQPKDRPNQNNETSEDDQSERLNEDATVSQNENGDVDAAGSSDPLKVVDAENEDTRVSEQDEERTSERPRRRNQRNRYRSRQSEDETANGNADAKSQTPDGATDGAESEAVAKQDDDAGLKAMMARTAPLTETTEQSGDASDADTAAPVDP